MVPSWSIHDSLDKHRFSIDSPYLFLDADMADVRGAARVATS
jgi:hypothetical protein